MDSDQPSALKSSPGLLPLLLGLVVAGVLCALTPQVCAQEAAAGASGQSSPSSVSSPASAQPAEPVSPSPEELKKEVAELFSEAKKLYKKKEYRQAQLQLRKVLELDPVHTEAMDYLNRVRKILLKDAGVDFKKKVVELNAKITAIDLEKNRFTVDTGEADEVKVGTVMSYYQRDRRLADFEVIAVEPGSSTLTMLASHQRLLKVGGELKVDVAQGVFQKGLMALAEGDTDSAAAAFGDTILNQPGHAPSYVNLALLRARNNDYSAAVTLLEEAIKFNPHNMEARKRLIEALVVEGELEEALNVAQGLVQKAIKDPDAHYRAGLLAVSVGDFTQAENELTFVRNVDSKNETAVAVLAFVYLMQEEYSRAQQKLEQAQEIASEGSISRPFVHALYSYLFEQQGNQAKAGEQMRTAKELNPELAAAADLSLESAGALLVETAFSNLVEGGLLAQQPSPYEQSAVSKKVAEEVLRSRSNQLALAQQAGRSTKKRLPLGLSGKITNTFEHYNRDPMTAYPMSGTHLTTDLETEFELMGADVNFDIKAFHNKWDSTVLDFVKINIKDKSKKNEVDIGEFSSSHFGDLIKHGEVRDGIRFWHQAERAEKKPLVARINPGYLDFSTADSRPVNIGQIYQEEFVDKRLFKTTETTVVVGRTQRPKSLNDKKEENFETRETSGQFERNLTAVRVETNPYWDAQIGAGFIHIKDDKNSADTSATTTPIENYAWGIDGEISALDERLKLSGDWGYTWYDPDSDNDSDDEQEDYGSLVEVEFDPWSELGADYTWKRIGKAYKLDGASQTADRATHTVDLKYTPSGAEAWDLSSADFKFEFSHDDLDRDQNKTKKYRTVQPKVSFKLPDDAKLSFDLKLYEEHWSCLCTFYRTKTLKTDFDWTFDPWKMTFKPTYTHERKNDLTGSPSDEHKKDAGLSIDWDFWEDYHNLQWTFGWDKEIKTFSGSSSRGYVEDQWSIAASFEIVEDKWDVDAKFSFKDRRNTDTDNNQLETFKLTTTYELVDGKIVGEYEHKDNPYDPDTSTSAYNQDYFKLQYVRDF